MQAGTTGAFRYPYGKQVDVNVSRTLTSQDLNGVIIVDSSAGPVTIALPPAIETNAGGSFLIFAQTADINPVTVILNPGDTYNEGLVAPVTLTTKNEQLLVLGQSLQTAWLYLPSGAGGGGPASLAVADEGIVVETGVTLIDFVGANVTATNPAVGEARIEITLGAGTVVNTFLDNTTLDLIVGVVATDALVQVVLALTQGTTPSRTYKIQITSDGSAVSQDIVQIPDMFPTVDVSVVVVGPNIVVRLTGSGAGTSTKSTHRVTEVFAF